MIRHLKFAPALAALVIAACASAAAPKDQGPPPLAAADYAPILGDPARAVTILEPVAKANPRDTATQLGLADLYNDAGRDTDAERTLRQLLEIEPANAEALNYLGYLLANRGRSLEEARASGTLPASSTVTAARPMWGS